jgi:hypothetical protein
MGTSAPGWCSPCHEVGLELEVEGADVAGEPAWFAARDLLGDRLAGGRP